MNASRLENCVFDGWFWSKDAMKEK
jgi:hypothetical protein